MMTQAVEKFPKLGPGRYDRQHFQGRHKGIEKHNCSECGQEFYTKTRTSKRILKTCSPECSVLRKSRMIIKNYKKRDLTTKQTTIHIPIPTYQKIQEKANKKHLSVPKYICMLIERHVK